MPVDQLIVAATNVLAREGKSLANYGLQSGPQGYQPLRAFIANELIERTHMRFDADDILLTSGSLQAIDLVFEAFLKAVTRLYWKRLVTAACSVASNGSV